MDLLEDLRREILGPDPTAARRAELLHAAVEFYEWTEPQINHLLEKLGAGDLSLLDFALEVAREMDHPLQYVLEKASGEGATNSNSEGD